mgnify:CR=1 FL=1
MANMQYWDEIVDAQTLTGWARAEQEIASKDSLARFLPDTTVDDIRVEFEVGANGLVAEAAYRAYDAEPEIAGEERGEEVTIKLPAVSRRETIGEYAQLRLRGTQGGYEAAIQRAMRRAVRAVINTADRQRANVLVTGKATNVGRYKFSDDFGRDPRLTATASALFSDAGVDRIDELKRFRDVYEQIANAALGAIVVDRDAAAALFQGDQFRVQLVNGASRPAAEEEVQTMLEAAGLPRIEVHKGRTKTGAILPSGTALFLPAPVDPTDAEATELGATFWGVSLSATEAEYEIPEGEYPGIVAVAERSKSTPHVAQVTADSIQLPVLANANLSGALKVL